MNYDHIILQSPQTTKFGPAAAQSAVEIAKQQAGRRSKE